MFRLIKLVPDNTNIQFLKWRNIAMAISVALMVASIILVAVRGLNFGVDFVGGQMIRVTFEQSKEAPVAELREQVGKLGYGEPTIQRFGKDNQVSIRMKLPEEAEKRPEAANEMANTIVAAIKAEHKDARVDGVDSVSGKVSGELFQTGALALLASMVAISIYIWVRFEWQFGVGALFAREEVGVLSARTFADNRASQRMLEKLGFVREGLLQQVSEDEGGILQRNAGQTDEVFRLRALGHSLQQAFERYYIAISVLVKNGPGTLSAGELENLCQLAAQRLSLLYANTAPEFFDKSLFRGFIQKLRELKLVWADGNGKLTFDERLNAWAKDARVVLGRELRHTIEKISPDSTRTTGEIPAVATDPATPSA